MFDHSSRDLKKNKSETNKFKLIKEKWIWNLSIQRYLIRNRNSLRILLKALHFSINKLTIIVLITNSTPINFFVKCILTI